MESLGVVPVHPAERGELDLLDGLPGTLPGGAADQLGLVVAVDRLGQGVVEAVANAAGSTPASARRSVYLIATY